MTTRLVILVPLLAGCGLTFGVDAVDRVTDVEADPGDAAALAIPGVGVEDEVVVCGGADVVEAHIETTEWDGGGEADAVEAALVRVGDAIELQLGGGGETVTLQRIDVDMPETLGANLRVTDGGLTVCDLAAPVDVVAESVDLREIAAPATANADSVRVENTVPLELAATGNVTGTLGADGTIAVAGDLSLSLTSADFDTLDILSEATEQGAHVSLFVPPGGAWTISIQSDTGNGLVDVGGALYDSSAEDAPPLADGVTLEINGGGPLIQVTATSAGIFIRESAGQ